MRMFLLMALAGCGEYVAYDEDPKGQVAVRTPGSDDLDDTTRARFEALTTLDHLAFEAVLGRHVVVDDTQASVDYAGLSADVEATSLLAGYLAMLDAVRPDRLDGSAERQAYWYNAYNAAVLQGVLTFWEGDPTWSVSEQTFLFFDQPIWRFGGVVLSLNHIEHGIIRGDFGHASQNGLDTATRAAIEAFHTDLWQGSRPDPRLHVALNCASLSCPDLGASQPRAFRAATLEAQLTDLTRRFLHSPLKGAGPNGISSLFSWYQADFEAVGGSSAFIEAHREGGLSGVDTSRLLPYDWSLNVTR